jgi:hypothetical protein
MTLGVARDIALIILIVPALLCMLLPAALAFGAWWLARRAGVALRPRIRQASSGVRRTRDALDGATRAMTRPIYFGETQSVRWRAMWRALRRENEHG